MRERVWIRAILLACFALHGSPTRVRALSFRLERRAIEPVSGESRAPTELDENSTPVIVPPDWSGHLSNNGKVGQGAFGKVFDMTITCSDMHVAVKAMHGGSGEARYLEQLSSGRVLKVLAHGISYDEQWKEVDEWGYCIMTEFADAGDLSDLIKSNAQSVPFQKKIELVAEVFEGLAFLHGKGVVHNDVKPNNVLLFNGAGGLQAKLADVGLSCTVNGANGAFRSCQRKGTKNVGAPHYQSPEHRRTNIVDLPKDIWATGILVFYLFFGYGSRGPSAFELEEFALTRKIDEENVTASATGWEVHNGEFKFDFSILNSSVVPLKYWGTLQTLLVGLMKFDPGKRLTAQQALDLCMQMLDEALPDPKMVELPPCWNDRVISREAQLVTATEKGHPISKDLASNVHVNARGVALKHAVSWGHVETIMVLLEHEIPAEFMAEVVDDALTFAIIHGAPYLDSIIPALRVHMTVVIVDTCFLHVQQYTNKPYLAETLEWVLQASLLSDSAKVSLLREFSRKNLEQSACVLVDFMQDGQLGGMFKQLSQTVGQGFAGIVKCLLMRISRSTEPAVLQETINQQAIAASKKGRIRHEDWSGADRFGTFEMLVDRGISDDVASDILLWYVCREKEDLTRFDARFISKAVDRLAGKIELLSKALTGANERGHTGLASQLVDAGALRASDAEKVCKPLVAFEPPRRPRIIFPNK